MSSSSSSHSEFLSAVTGRTARVGVIGLGYVGLPLCLAFERAGFPVVGFDVDPDKVDRLNRGQSYIKHFSDDQIQQALAGKRLRATADFDALADVDAILICVPTPLTERREPDLSYVEQTGRDIAQRLRPGQLVVLESSTYPGTTDEVLLPILEASGIPCRAPAARAAAAGAGGGSTSAGGAGGGRAYVAYSPEREDPGNAQFTTVRIPKLVGGVDAAAAEMALALYAAAFERAVPVASAKVAEMAKILENTYRCVNIALVNELKQLCLRMGIDMWDVIEAAATKPFGFQAFYPGPGLGGHCIPIDPFYLSWKAKEFDFTARFIELAGEINTDMPYHVVEALANALNGQGKAVRGARILLLGVAYKRDIDDLRESPALKIYELLSKRGAEVSYYDPYCPHVHRGRHFPYELDSTPFQPADAAGYDCVMVTTDHSGLDYAAIARHARLLVDTRNVTRGMGGDNICRC
jgi:UDP-N-acetyl-D-glucosamine dehydrogenase